MNAKSSALEILNSRIIDAPRERVFEAFSNPDHLIHWWGPKGFTNTFKKFDFRPGGEWLFVMHGPDGKNYEITKQFVEIVKPERIVLQHVQANHDFRLTMSYEELSGKTKLTWRMVFEPAAENEKLKSFLLQANEQNFDRLEVQLKRLSGG